MNIYDHDTIRLNLRSEKATVRKEGRRLCERMIAQFSDEDETLSPSNTVGLLHAVVEYHTRELRARNLDLTIGEFMRRVVRFCMRYGQMYSQHVLVLADHIVQNVLNSQSWTNSFRSTHISILIEVLTPRFTHRWEGEDHQEGLGQLFLFLQSALLDTARRKDQLILKLLRSFCSCVLRNEEDLFSQLVALVSALVESETGHDAGGLAVLLTCLECCTVLLQYHGLAFVMQASSLLSGLMEKLHGKIAFGVPKEAHVDLFMKFIQAVMDALPRWPVISSNRDHIHDMTFLLQPPLAMREEMKLTLFALSRSSDLSSLFGATDTVLSSLLSESFLLFIMTSLTKKTGKGRTEREVLLLQSDDRISSYFEVLSKLLLWHMMLSSSRDETNIASGNERPLKRAKVDSPTVSLWSRLKEIYSLLSNAMLEQGASMELQHKNKLNNTTLLSAYLLLLKFAVPLDEEGCLFDDLLPAMPAISPQLYRKRCMHLSLTSLTDTLNLAMDSLHDSVLSECALLALLAILQSPAEPTNHQNKTASSTPRVISSESNSLPESISHLAGSIIERFVKLPQNASAPFSKSAGQLLLSVLLSCLLQPHLAMPDRKKMCSRLLSDWTSFFTNASQFIDPNTFLGLLAFLESCHSSPDLLPAFAVTRKAVLDDPASPFLPIALFERNGCLLAASLWILRPLVTSALKLEQSNSISAMDRLYEQSRYLLTLLRGDAMELNGKNSEVSTPRAAENEQTQISWLQPSELFLFKIICNSNSYINAIGAGGERHWDNMDDKVDQSLSAGLHAISDFLVHLKTEEVVEEREKCSWLQALLNLLSCYCCSFHKVYSIDKEKSVSTLSSMYLMALECVSQLVVERMFDMVYLSLRTLNEAWRRMSLLDQTIAAFVIQKCEEQLLRLGQMLGRAVKMDKAHSSSSRRRQSNVEQISFEDDEEFGEGIQLNSQPRTPSKGSRTSARCSEEDSDSVQDCFAAMVELYASIHQLPVLDEEKLLKDTASDLDKALASEQKISFSLRMALVAQPKLMHWCIESDVSLIEEWGFLGYCGILQSVLAYLVKSPSVDVQSDAFRLLLDWIIPIDEKKSACFHRSWHLRAYQLQCCGVILARCDNLSDVKEEIVAILSSGLEDSSAQVRLIAARNMHLLLKHFKKPTKVYDSLVNIARQALSSPSASNKSSFLVATAIIVTCNLGLSEHCRRLLWKVALMDILVVLHNRISSGNAVDEGESAMWKQVASYVVGIFAKTLGYLTPLEALELHVEWMVYHWLTQEVEDQGRTDPAAGLSIKQFPFFAFSRNDGVKPMEDAEIMKSLQSRIVAAVCCITPSNRRWQLLGELSLLILGGAADKNIYELVCGALVFIRSAEFEDKALSAWSPQLPQAELNYVSGFLERVLTSRESSRTVDKESTTAFVIAVVRGMILQTRLKMPSDEEIIERWSREDLADLGNRVSMKQSVVKDIFEQIAKWLLWPSVAAMFEEVNAPGIVAHVKCTIREDVIEGQAIKILALLTYLVEQSSSAQLVTVASLCLGAIDGFVSAQANTSISLAALSVIPPFIDCLLSRMTEATTDLISDALSMLFACNIPNLDLVVDRNTFASQLTLKLTQSLPKENNVLLNHLHHCRLFMLTMSNSHIKAELRQTPFAVEDLLDLVIGSAERYMQGNQVSVHTLLIQLLELRLLLSESRDAISSDERLDALGKFLLAVLASISHIPQLHPNYAKMVDMIVDILSVLTSRCVNLVANDVMAIPPSLRIEGNCDDVEKSQLEGLWRSLFDDLFRIALSGQKGLTDLSLLEDFFDNVFINVAQEQKLWEQLDPMLNHFARGYAERKGSTSTPHCSFVSQFSIFFGYSPLSYPSIGGHSLCGGSKLSNVMKRMAEVAWSDEVWTYGHSFGANADSCLDGLISFDDFVCKLSFHVLLFYQYFVRDGKKVFKDAQQILSHHLLSAALGVALVDKVAAQRVFLLVLYQVLSCLALSQHLNSLVTIPLVFQKLSLLCSSQHSEGRKLGSKAVTLLLRVLSSDFKIFRLILSNQPPSDGVSGFSVGFSVLSQWLDNQQSLIPVTRAAIQAGDCYTASLLIELIAEVADSKRDSQGKSDSKLGAIDYWAKRSEGSSRVVMVKDLLTELVASQTIEDKDMVYALDVGSDLRLQAMLYQNAKQFHQALSVYETILQVRGPQPSLEAERGMMSALAGLGAKSAAQLYASQFCATDESASKSLQVWSLPDVDNTRASSLRQEVPGLHGLHEDLRNTLRHLSDNVIQKESASILSTGLRKIVLNKMELDCHEIASEIKAENCSPRHFASLGLLSVSSQLSILSSTISRTSPSDGLDLGRVFALLQVANRLLQTGSGAPMRRGMDDGRECSILADGPQLYVFWSNVRELISRQRCTGGSLSEQLYAEAGNRMLTAQLDMQESLFLWQKGLKDAALKKIDCQVCESLKDSVSRFRSSKKMDQSLTLAGQLFLSEALLTRGVWLGEKGCHSKTEVIDEHLEPALAASVQCQVQLQTMGSAKTWWLLDASAQAARTQLRCHLAMACYFEQKYHNFQAKVMSREWYQRQQHLNDRSAELEECSKLLDQLTAEMKKEVDNNRTPKSKAVAQQMEENEKERKNLFRYCINLKREIAMDAKERDSVLVMRKESLLSGIKHYVSALKFISSASTAIEDVEVVFRLVGLWLSGTNTAATHDDKTSLADALQAASEHLLENIQGNQIPLHHFIPLHQQILSRLGSAQKGMEEADRKANEAMQEAIRSLAVALGTAFPFHILPTLFSLLHNNIDNASSASIGTEQSFFDRLQSLSVLSSTRHVDNCQQDDRQTVTWHVLSTIHRKRQESLGYQDNTIDQMQKLLMEYIMLARTSTSDLHNRGRSKGIRFGDVQLRGRRFNEQLQQCISTASLPILTTNIPVSLSGPQKAGKSFVSIVGCVDKFDVTDTGISRPKIITLIGSDGQQYKQLVKGGDDLRQDAVMQQVFATVNLTLQRHPPSQHQDEAPYKAMRIRTYKVIPTTAQTGILEFVGHTAAFGGILCDPPAHNKHALPFTKLGLHSRHRPKDWSHAQCREHLKNAEDSGENKLARFMEIYQHFQPAFRYFFLEQYRHPAAWYASRCNYIHSTAVNSMVGYVLGIGDRHAHNILLDLNTAELIHIDFGIVFEQGQLLTVPEVVPFRLTRDVVDGMGVMGVEGKFRRCCEHVLRTLQEHSVNLMVILEVVIFDPLYKWSLSPLQARNKQHLEQAANADDPDPPRRSHRMGLSARNAAPTPPDLPSNTHIDAANKTLSRIRAKLQGFEEQLSAGDVALSVEELVSVTINAAREPANLCRIFPGWSPWL